MKRLLLASVAVVALSSAAPAQAIFCTNCSTPISDAAQQAENQAWTEAWEGLQWARSLEQQITQVKYEILGWVEWVKSNAALPFRLYNDITSPVREIQGLVQEASLLSERSKFLISDLTHPSGYGGSLEDIPAALAQENRALSWSMQQFGMSMQRSQGLSSDYVAKLNELASQDVSGPTQAAQVTAQIAATRGQQEAADMATQNAAFQALATASLRDAHRSAMLDAKVQQNQRVAISASCGQLTVIRPPICQSQAGATQVASAQ